MNRFQNVVIVNICLTIYNIQIVTRGYVTLNCFFTAIKTLQTNLVFCLLNAPKLIYNREESKKCLGIIPPLRKGTTPFVMGVLSPDNPIPQHGL